MFNSHKQLIIFFSVYIKWQEFAKDYKLKANMNRIFAYSWFMRHKDLMEKIANYSFLDSLINRSGDNNVKIADNYFL